MVTLQAPEPAQAPVQLLNNQPAAGVALRETTVPELYEAEHVTPQLIPEGDDVTVPEPETEVERVKA